MIAAIFLIGERIGQFVSECRDYDNKMSPTVFVVYEININTPTFNPSPYGYITEREAYYSTHKLPEYTALKQIHTQYLPYVVDPIPLIKKQIHLKNIIYKEGKIKLYEYYDYRVPEFSAEQTDFDCINISSDNIAFGIERYTNACGTILLVSAIQKRPDFTDEEFLTQCDIFIPQYIVLRLQTK